MNRSNNTLTGFRLGAKRKWEEVDSQINRLEKSILLIRILVGWVFVSEGVQKFLFPANLGIGRFAKIGIPAPGVLAPFVGMVEIVFGSLVLLGLFTRLASLPLLVDILVALATTKIPFLLQHGLWSALHETRTDLSMLLGLLFLLMVGGGSLSLDSELRRRNRKPSSVSTTSSRGES